MRLFWILLLLLSTSGTLPQSEKPDHCNHSMTFCWYGPFRDGSDEVDAWGNQWKADDPTESPIKQTTAVRCIKRLHICIEASTQTIANQSVTHIDLFNVRSWDDLKVEAVNDEIADPKCEQEALTLNRVEQSAILISSPGAMASGKGCTAFMGTPKTVLYRLR
jgi:hypothetical protein